MSTNPLPGSSRPITLLSGFLGAGKTTLLRHILHNADGLKCAVLVNDMAASNVDASTVIKDAASKSDDLAEQKLVRLQNGCVCCTLSDEMVTAIVELAREGQIDYIIIESSGIANPADTAAALTHGVIDDECHTELQTIAHLDTCVTMVDAVCLMDNLHTIETLQDRQEGSGEAGASDAASYSYVSQLLIDQIEFADVIILNKQELLAPHDLEVAKSLLLSINSNAQVLCTSFAKVDLSKVINTGRFDYEKASLASAWLHPRAAPHGADADAPQPHANHHTCSSAQDGPHSGKQAASKSAPAAASTAHDSACCESHCSQAGCTQHDCNDPTHRHASSPMTRHGVSSFVYKARKPFHPQRILDFMMTYFVVQEPNWKAELGLGQSAEGDDSEAARAEHQPIDQEAAAKRQAARTAAFGTVLRSKGFAWVAGAERHDHCVEWNSSGNVLRFGSGGPWFACIPREHWPQENLTDIAGDFDADETIGDRRQEIVVIGAEMRDDELRRCLDACLCSEEEVLNADTLQDPLAWWPHVHEMMGNE